MKNKQAFTTKVPQEIARLIGLQLSIFDTQDGKSVNG